MKLILNIESVKYPLTGIGRYTFELAKQLQDSPELEKLYYNLGYRLGSCLPDDNTVQNNDAVVKNNESRVKALLKKNRLIVGLYQKIVPQVKRYKFREYSDFIYHGPNFYLPPFPGKSIATFHDLSIFVWPEYHPTERVRFMRKELALTIKRADALITDSEYTRRELADYFNYPLNKIFAVPLASSGNFYPRTKEMSEAVLAKYRLEYGNYVLFTGSIEPRKNLVTLIEAYQRLPLSLRQKYPLVISGFKGWKSDDIHKKMEQGKSEGWLYYLGYTPLQDLPVIFSGALLFVFPSQYEGFGLPVLEAMASGTPVICSNAASLPEVAGSCALMFDALDVEELTELLKKGIEDEQWRQEARISGLQRASEFSWQRCADETIKVYQQVESR